MNSRAASAPVAPKPRPRAPRPVSTALAAVLAPLVLATVAHAQLATHGPDSPSSRRQLGDTLGAVRTYREVLDSSLILLHTDRPGCTARLWRGDRLVAELDPSSPTGCYFRYRAFRIPREGELWTARIAKPGYRPTSLSFPLVPRTIARGGVILASTYEADRICFEAAGAGGAALVTALPDGSGQAVLVDTPEADSEPAVAPDGFRVAFCTGAVGWRAIRLLDRRTGRIETLVDSPSADEHGPRWLDAESLVYVHGEAGRERLYRLRPGGRPSELFPAAAGSLRDPAPRLGGDTILFSTDAFGAGWDIAEGDPRTGAITRVTDSEGDETHPVAQPGGAAYAYIVSGAGSGSCVLAWPEPPEPGAPSPASPALVLTRPFGEGADSLAWSSDGRVLLCRRGPDVLACTPPLQWLATPVASSGRGGALRWVRLARLPDEPQLVEFHLETGTVLVRLDTDHAAAAVQRFLARADAGGYDGAIVHRVVEGQAVQLGCPLGNGAGGGAAIAVEPGGAVTRGALAFEPEWGGQSPVRLLFCLADLPELDGCCTAFGRVLRGMGALEGAMAGDRLTRVTRLLFDEDDLAP